MIRKLPEEVIIKIAAGEVIERPVNGLKELMENSIDAGATAISMSVSDGGLSRLEIADNGKGIHPDDYPLLCERFATSKLSTYQDLDRIGSFGFRGEALASLSYVGNVEVISRIKENNLAYKAEFKDGKLIGDLSPVSRNVGTTIKVSNLFLNLTVRRKSLNGNEQKRRILKLINNFALHYSSIRFQLLGDKGVELKIDCLPNPLDSRLRHFSQVFNLQSNSFFPSSNVINDIQLTGIFTKLSVSKAKSKTLILFINNRLVQYSDIFKSIQKGYSTCYTSIHQHLQTFNVYLSLTVDPKYVDCNIHPTKKEVKIVGSNVLCEGLTKWVVEVVKDNCRIKSVGRIEPISFGSRGVDKKEVMGYDKVRVEPMQLPIKYFINERKGERDQRRESEGEEVRTVVKREQNPHYSPPKHMIEQLQPSQDPSTQDRAPLDNPIKPPLLKQLPPFHPSQPLPPASSKPQSVISQFFSRPPSSFKSKQIVPFTLTIPDQKPIHPIGLEVKQFVHNFTYIGCYNLNYIFIQYKHALLFLNLLPFLYPTLISHIKKNQELYIETIKEISVVDTLKHLKNKKGLDFDIDEYLNIIMANRDQIAKQTHIYVDEDGNVSRVCYPAECLKGKYSMLEIGYFLARTAKLFSSTEQINTQSLHKYLVEYFVKLFKCDYEIQGDQHLRTNEFIETKLIPLMKTRVSFPDMDITKYFTNVVELKSLYTIFERC